MILRLSLWKDFRERILILFGFAFNVSRFHSSIRFGDCDVCYLFFGKLSRAHRLELID